jgi:hypothetical protein
MTSMQCIIRLVGAAILVSIGLLAFGDEPGKPAAKELESVRVPYQLSDTKHIVVRAKVNGKGPLNFIVDTGAPLLYVGTEAAKRIELQADKAGWAILDKLEIEGGVKLEKVRGRVEDPFQLVGMNKMNLPGIRYDGILGYTVLAQFRIQFDFTDTHLVWTKLDWKPPTPVGLLELGGKMPAELSAMSGLVGLVSGMIGRRPDAELVYRGFIGVELEEKDNAIIVKKVLSHSPAADAGLREADRLVRIQDQAVRSLKDLHAHAAEWPSGEELRVEIERGGETKNLTIKTIKGL